ncbi:MAG: hypothetical protein AAF957_11965 [Planctomycetota bacterium]
MTSRADQHTAMRHSKTLLTAALVSLLAACSNPEKAAEPVNAEVASSGAETQELDPNDPNVLVCPVTGAMELKKPEGEEAVGEDHGKGGDYDGGEYGAHHPGTQPQDDN